MAISAQLVKELREKTGAGMLDCKNALQACDGNLEAAFDWLREKGIAKAAKKADRIAAEGLTAFCVEGNNAAVVEINSETDFVAQNQEFKDLVNAIAKCVCENQPATMEEANACLLDGETIETVIVNATAKIGEKLSFRRFEALTKADDQQFGAYSHMGGKISSIVLLTGASESVAKDVAMHVAASAPAYIDRNCVPAEVLEREKTVLLNQALEENAKAAKPKPQNIIEKMLEGRLNKSLAEMCLVDQAFIKDPDLTVAKFIGAGKVEQMVRYQVGEGMQKREDNFAAEVAAAVK